MKNMNPEGRFERIERLIEFLAAEQAQLTASVHAHEILMDANSRKMGQLEDVMLRLARIVEAQAKHMDEGFSRLTESHRKLDESHQKLSESQARTDERLNALINMIERSRGLN